ncbi:pentatricopeptide repeat-containing protein At5g14080 isoform X1 [Olea europaea var. sylvestris]|uniref:Pentatricopeptide repeat-containing At5g14080 n=1 Tax=Olea europaea subsp. europaea TaxID=158383 RepID=A0A8S0PQX2_OLEEU|nr:pentatricopeptide repeat-containing protein At5g14080 isoform X1 [Olea europaea var. sylvestris]CAA2955107.1 pentatricopeptide repeat-containing At5g14080 [Olea europaea subsp. europaea]
MRRSVSDFASVVSRALIAASNQAIPNCTWAPSLEQTLHRLACRESLSPALVSRVIDPFLLNHHTLALGFFNWASQQPGFCHTSTTYQAILKSLSLSRQYNAIEKLFKEVKAHRIHLSPDVYGSMIGSLISGKKTHLAFLVFTENTLLTSEIGPKTCNSLLAALSSDGNVQGARKVFDDMISRGVKLTTLGFGVFIWRFCRNNELSETLSLLDKVREVDFSGINGSVIAVLVVHGLCSEGRLTDVVYALEELKKRGCKPDFMAYRIVAETMRMMRRVVDVEMVLKKKRKLGVAPRANDYREFIHELISERLICEAKELGEVIVSGNFPIEDDVLNVLIGSVSSIDPVHAVLFLKFMLETERYPTLLTLSNLSGNLCKHGKTDELVEVYQVLSVKDYFKDLESYNMMVSFLCKAGRVKETYQVLQEMKKKGLSPDVSSYNYLLEACCREDLVRPAKRLWDEMFSNGCSGNLKSYNILIQRLSEIGQVEDAHRLFCHMMEKGLRPDATTYISLLEGFCQAKNLEMALKVFNQSVEHDLMLANNILSTFTLCLCKEGFFLAASKLLRDRISDIGYTESHMTLLKYLADAGELSLVIEHIKWVREKSHTLLHCILTEVSVALSSSSKSDAMLQLFQILVENDKIPENLLSR